MNQRSAAVCNCIVDELVRLLEVRGHVLIGPVLDVDVHISEEFRICAIACIVFHNLQTQPDEQTDQQRTREQERGEKPLEHV